MKDPLFEATRALRQQGELESEASRFTRARVLLGVRQRQHNRLRRSVFVIPLAALAVGSVALAASGGHLPNSVQRWVTQVAAVFPKPPQRPKSKVARAASPGTLPASGLAVSAPDATEPAPEFLPVASAAALAPEPSAQRSAISVALPTPTSSNPQRALPGDSPITEAEFLRYRLAHEAHFVKKDPAAALAAWSDYLAHAPSGQLAVEARYNQALCLLKLGRAQEARRALLPFVSGKFGAYRRQEAQTLIATLDADAGR